MSDVPIPPEQLPSNVRELPSTPNLTRGSKPFWGKQITESDRATRLSRWVKQGAPVNLKLRLSHVLLTGLGCYVAALPALVDDDLADKQLALGVLSVHWLWVYVPGLMVVAIGTQLTNGIRVQRWARFIRDHAATLASNINALSEHHWGNPADGWSTDRVIADLLQGIVDTTIGYGSLSDTVEVSATLFVEEATSAGIFLKVYERNRLRQWRNLRPIPETDLGPAATCYRTNARVVVPDVRDWANAQEFNTKDPGSIVAFPVQCGAGLSHGVVIVDVARAGFFRESLLDEGLDAILSPHLMLIGQAYTTHVIGGH